MILKIRIITGLNVDLTSFISLRKFHFHLMALVNLKKKQCPPGLIALHFHLMALVNFKKNNVRRE